MRAALVAIAAAGVSVAATPAAAQLRPEAETGSLIRNQPTAVQAREAGMVRKGFAHCVFSQARTQATALLAYSDSEVVDLNGAGITNVQSQLSLPSCLGEQVSVSQSALSYRFTPTQLRDLLAEEAYLAANKGAPAVPSPVDPLPARFVATGASLERARGTTEFMDCAVLQDVSGADALLRTMPGSAEEGRAAAAMAPALGRCLFEGQDVELNAAGIRSMIAYGMWNRFVRGAAK